MTVIGNDNKAEITLPKGNGLHKTIIEEFNEKHESN